LDGQWPVGAFKMMWPEIARRMDKEVHMRIEKAGNVYTSIPTRN
jgi:hypothetical protein